MQTKERYWEGLYWDGFAPEMVGAVPLTDVSSEDAAVSAALKHTLDQLAEEKQKVDDFFVTLVEHEPKPKPAASAAGGKAMGALLIVRLWHKNVFIGARDSAVGDPGALNRDYHYDPTGKFIASKKWEETEALLDSG